METLLMRPLLFPPLAKGMKQAKTRSYLPRPLRRLYIPFEHALDPAIHTFLQS